MERRLISSGSSFERDIGYSRAVVLGEWVFVSGTTGFDYADDDDFGTVSPSRPSNACSTSSPRFNRPAPPSPTSFASRTSFPGPKDFPECWPILRKYFGDDPAGRDHDFRWAGGSADENRSRGDRLPAVPTMSLRRPQSEHLNRVLARVQRLDRGVRDPFVQVARGGAGGGAFRRNRVEQRARAAAPRHARRRGDRTRGARRMRKCRMAVSSGSRPPANGSR